MLAHHFGQEVNAENHCWCILEGHIADGPRNSTNLGTNLYQDLIADRTNAFALQSFGADALARNPFLLNKEILDFLITKTVFFGSGQQEDTHLHLTTNDIELVSVFVELIAFKVNDFGRIHGVVKGLYTLLDRVDKLLTDITLTFGAEDTPHVERRLIIHFGLCFSIKIGGRLDHHLISLIGCPFAKDHSPRMQLCAF